MFQILESHLAQQFVREHKRNVLNYAVSKADFVDLMKKSFDELAPQTIRNGFKASELFPQDSNNIDYNKCSGKNFIRVDQEVVSDVVVPDIIPQMLKLKVFQNKTISQRQQFNLISYYTVAKVVDSLDVKTIEKYTGVLVDPPIPQRQNKRMLRVKPHFVLTSKPEIKRKLKLKEDKAAEETAKQNRLILRDEKKQKKIQDKVRSVQNKVNIDAARLKKRKTTMLRFINCLKIRNFSCKRKVAN